MPDSIQFCVIRLSTNSYKIIVQNEEEIIRSSVVQVADVLDKLGYELEQLKSK